jgi:hypothetical protein
MQNREELRQKGPKGSQETTCRERGKNIIFRRGGGINIVFGPKYRPLCPQVQCLLWQVRTVSLDLSQVCGVHIL